MHLDILFHTSDDRIDAIAEHSRLLVDSINDLDEHSAVAIDLAVHGRTAGISSLLSREANAVVLQYNPFSFSAKGVPVWLISALRRLRRARPDVPLVFLAHELYVPWQRNRSAFAAAAQRGLVARLSREANVRFACCERFARSLALWSGGPVKVLPVGSNLPLRLQKRTATRARIGASDSTLVLATFGRNHPARLHGYTAAALTRVAELSDDVRVLNLGADAPKMTLRLPEGHLIEPGLLDAATTAELVAAADLFLLPFVDGVSVRRGTLMAALQHKVAVVGTEGRNTDHVLRAVLGAALTATSDGADRYAAAVTSFALDPSARQRTAEVGAAFHVRRCTWSAIATALTDELTAA